MTPPFVCLYIIRCYEQSLDLLNFLSFVSLVDVRGLLIVSKVGFDRIDIGLIQRETTKWECSDGSFTPNFSNLLRCLVCRISTVSILNLRHRDQEIWYEKGGLVCPMVNK